MPRISTIVTSMSTGDRATSVRMASVASVREPQKARLRGVMTMASSVEMAVIDTESAALDFE